MRKEYVYWFFLLSGVFSFPVLALTDAQNQEISQLRQQQLDNMVKLQNLAPNCGSPSNCEQEKQKILNDQIAINNKINQIVQGVQPAAQPATAPQPAAQPVTAPQPAAQPAAPAKAAAQPVTAPQPVSQINAITGILPYADFGLWATQGNIVNWANAAGVDGVCFAFITEDPSGNPTVAGRPMSAYAAPIQALAQAGKKVILSFGGANGAVVGKTGSEDAIYNKLKSILDAVGPKNVTGLDFDIEGGHKPSSSQVTLIAKACKRLQDSYGLAIRITLAVLPSGLVPEDQAIFNAFKLGGCDFHVNIMAMDYGPGFVGKDMGAYSIEAAEATQSSTQLPWDHIQVTPMIGVNDVKENVFRIEDIKKLAAAVKGKGAKSISHWSINRDHASAGQGYLYDNSGTDSSGKPTQSSDWEFSKAIKDSFGS